MEVYTGTILPWPIPYAPEPDGWAFCDGRLLDINQYQPLYTLIGVTYGGNGTNTFALPNLIGNIPVGANSSGPPSTNAKYNLGQTLGSDKVTLNSSNTPVPPHVHPLDNHTHSVGAHNHTLNSSSNISFSFGIPANTDAGDTSIPGTTTCFANGTSNTKATLIYNTKPSTLTMSAHNVTTNVNISGNTGNSTAFNAGNGVVQGTTTGFNSTNPSNNNNVVQIPVTQPSFGLNFIICLNGIYPVKP
jgi:microcystin-dependent protein